MVVCACNPSTSEAAAEGLAHAGGKLDGHHEFRPVRAIARPCLINQKINIKLLGALKVVTEFFLFGILCGPLRSRLASNSDMST